MLSRFSLALTKHTRGWMVWTALALTALFYLFILPAAQAEIVAVSGADAKLLDVRFFYTPQETRTLLEALGAVGRARYRAFALGLDILFPVVYNVFLCLALAWSLCRSFAPQRAAQRLTLLPMGSLLCDWLENAAIAILLTVYPAQLAGIAWLATVFTLLKWTLIGVCAMLLLAAFAAMWKLRHSRPYAD